MTEGQSLAIEQLREIESTSRGSFEILEVREDSSNADWVWVTISVQCGNLPRAQGGLPLRPRERMILSVSRNFPFDIPGVWVNHLRFAGFAHVQWGRHLCLYQSPGTEWDSSDGMYGLIDRLDLWLRKGAIDELDETGAPLHPPVTYVPVGPIRSVIPRVNTPAVEGGNWYGTAHLKTFSDVRVDITGWSSAFSDDTPQDVAAAVLLSQPMPFEFPATVQGLFSELASRGVALRVLLLTLQWAVVSNAEASPLYLIIGAPMRGIRGAAQLKQHLTAWYIPPVLVDSLRLALEAYKEDLGFRRIGERAEALFLDWAKEAKVEWCIVREDRPEIVIRRDDGAATNWFRGRKVSLWGCGALGGHVAECLTRAGVGKLILHDNGIVGPGILARQPYDDADIGRPKVLALHDRLKRIRPELEIETHSATILVDPLRSDNWTDGADIVIETTANATVLAMLELRRREDGDNRAPIISMAIGHEANKSLVAVATAKFCGGPEDVLRRVKIEVLNRELKAFADEFWPAQGGLRRKVFQPEPGCSESTFIGSEADMAALSGVMLNQAAQDLIQTDDESAAAHFFAAPHIYSEGTQRADFHFKSDIVSDDPGSGYEVRLSYSSLRDILAWMEKSRRGHGGAFETGGLLFGERDEATKIIWISEISGPPPDSIASKDGFICGVEGTSELNDEKASRTRNAVQYLGMWHSHPGSSPEFSPTDLAAMHHLVMGSSFSPSKSLLMIVGTPSGRPMFGCYLFSRSDFTRLLDEGKLERHITIRSIPEIAKPKRIGLALSGGGSRAIAFHLGCLRALHDRGLLEQVELVSGVSGGAVIAGMYGYSNDSFDEFDRRTVILLRSGLQSKIARRTLLSRRVIQTLGTNLTAGLASVGVGALKAALLPFPDGSRIREKLHAPLRRWVTATTAFEDVLDKLLFQGRKLTDPRRDDLGIVFNACELRTGSAFRFASTGSHCWRYGTLLENDISVAFAVAASAAYPVMLPAIDRHFTFRDRRGREFRQRVVLTDGGVFDNLGVTCLEPGRSIEYSGLAHAPQYIISCDAGQGLFEDSVRPYYWPSRMKRAFESMHRKAHDSIIKRLHDHAAAGRLDGFVLSYLGQQDNSLPLIPPDLIRRHEVVGYPTDFRAMSARDIELIAGRGEQLTRLLVTRYITEI